MNEWFQKLHEFLVSAEQKAADAAKKGADVLRKWADYIDGLASGEKMAMEMSDAELKAFEGRCAELTAKCGAEAPPDKKIDPATILMILQLITTILDAIRKRRNPQPA